jgi:hypothetical protein
MRVKNRKYTAGGLQFLTTLQTIAGIESEFSTTGSIVNERKTNLQPNKLENIYINK